MRLLVAALLLLSVPALAEPAEQAVARRVRADVEFLASDNLEGRDTGSRGYAVAADYVASQFRAIGLEPAGEKGGWFQQVPFRRASFDKPPRLTLTISGQTVALEQGKDAALRPSVTAKMVRQSAGLVFAGTTWLAFSPKHFAMVNVGLILVWLGVAFLLGRMFKERSGGEI